MPKIGGGVRFYANNGKFPVDGGDAVMISLAASKERNLSRLWDSSGFYVNNSKLAVDGGDAVMISLGTSKERNLYHLEV